MMRYLILVVTIFCSICLVAQPYDSLRIHIDYGATDPDLRFYMRSNDIEFFKIKISNTSQKQVKLFLVSKAVKAGQVVRVDTINSWQDHPRFLLNSSDSVQFSAMTSHITDDSLRFNFEMDKGGGFYIYASKLKSDDYSFRDALNSDGSDVHFPFNESKPFLVYALPYIDPKYPNRLNYCELTNDGIVPDEWFTRYGIAHYIIFELKAEME